MTAQKPHLLNLVMGILSLLAAGGIFVLEQMVPAIALAALGVFGLILSLIKYRGHRNEVEEWKQELTKAELAYEKAQTEHQELLKKKDRLEGNIRQFLKAPEGTDIRELENRWKMTRQYMYQYTRLKQTYEEQRLEAQRQRKSYLDYWNSCPEEEWEVILHAPKPAENLDALTARLPQRLLPASVSVI